MEQLDVLIRRLPERHQEALRWFVERAGQEHPWPQPLETVSETTLLASKAKGIYKPKWSRYALSVRQTLGGSYPDLDPVTRADGTWSYAYFQENEDPAARDKEFTNRGLVACWRDKVPVGVMRQVAGRPNVRYRILGVALVAGWDAGYFFLEGFSTGGISRGPGPAAQIDLIMGIQETADDASEMFDPASIEDARERILRSIVRRRGQLSFRRALLELCGSRCAVTGCSVEEVLEAAHITPYRGDPTNHPTNGLLLRSDIHVLFDLGLVSVEPETRRVVVAPELRHTDYADLQGKQLAEPRDRSRRPTGAALAEHYRWAQLGDRGGRSRDVESAALRPGEPEE